VTLCGVDRWLSSCMSSTLCCLALATDSIVHSMITAVSVSPRHRLSLGDADDWASHGKRLQRRAQSVRLPLLYDWCSSKMGVDHLPPIERGYGLSVCCRLLSVVARRVRWEGASCAHRSRGVVASAAYLTHRFVARDDTREIIVCVMQMLWME
jgi:hypothetical protein